LDHLTHAVIAISRKTAATRRARLPTIAPARKFGVVPIGIPIREIPREIQVENRRRTRRELGIHERTVVIGCVVRLVTGKGLDDLIDASAIAMRERPCRLVLVGDGPLRSKLEALAVERGIRDYVHFAGYHPDPSPFLDAIDIFALPVLLGSGSVALLEAMSRRLPSVITFCGPEEAVIPNRTGLGAPPGDPVELANALLRLVESPELRDRLGAAGAAYVRQSFTIARVADDLLALYATARRGRIPTRLRAE
jgi:glycosyltransferase involved in cell wall biosynthesis